MIWTGDPIRDFNRHDSEQREWLAKLPKCDLCGEPIQDDYYWEVAGDKYCEECAQKMFRHIMPEV